MNGTVKLVLPNKSKTEFGVKTSADLDLMRGVRAVEIAAIVFIDIETAEDLALVDQTLGVAAECLGVLSPLTTTE